ncbi:MAG: gfo/Idh/MocA family oxidoreductase [Chitinivibrionales bacterium]|nr:gfo/Idh/MocA family oxidoreductase [Chitinivibrionales bacterium]
MQPVKTGIVGCGKICPAYVNNLKAHFAHLVDVVACADIDANTAKACADELGIPAACTTDELLARSDIELVVNLTNPGAHHPVSMRALEAGKHVFVEKPLATTLELASELVETAASAELTLAGAADTFLGAGLQTCRVLMDRGEIGEIGTAQALIALGFKSDRYLTVYGGPLFDMAPYYTTALVALLGPVVRVTGFVSVGPGERDTSSVLAFPFETPLTAAAVLEFRSGLIATLHASAEGCCYLPRVDIFGSDATLRLTDANSCSGTVVVRDREQNERTVALEKGFSEQGRGLGVAEQALAIREGRSPKADGRLGYHVLDILHAVRVSAKDGRAVRLESTCEQPGVFDAASVLGE